MPDPPCTDHADPDQFWYLPAPVCLARRGADNEAAFTFIKYKPAVVQAGVEGGGFLMFYTEEPRRLRAAMASAGLEEVRFRFDFEGTKVLLA